MRFVSYIGIVNFHKNSLFLVCLNSNVSHFLIRFNTIQYLGFVLKLVFQVYVFLVLLRFFLQIPHTNIIQNNDEQCYRSVIIVYTKLDFIEIIYIVSIDHEIFIKFDIFMAIETKTRKVIFRVKK